MGYAYRYCEELNLLVVRLWGELPHSEELEAITVGLADPRLRPGLRILADRRQATITSSSVQMRGAVDLVKDKISKIGKPKVANVVAKDVDFGMVRMFEMQAESRLPHDFMVFRSVAEACSWLEIDPAQVQWPEGEDC